MEINKKRRRSFFMLGEIAHKHVKNVIIQEKVHEQILAVAVSTTVGNTIVIRFYLSTGAFDSTLNLVRRATMIKAVKFVSIPVRDQEQALAFYTEKLGFQIVTDQPFDAKQRWIELRIPGSGTRVVLFTPPGHEDRIGTFSNVTFMTDDIDRTHQELTARGVVFTAPPTKQPWGQFAKFQDMDGNQFVLSTK
jgi:predicted enzyme related to lactoylglutathione lyase